MTSGRATLLIAPVALGVVMLVAWQVAVDVFDIPVYFVPAPRGILAQLGDQHASVWAATRVTGWNALRGLVVGAVLGVVGALVGNTISIVKEMAAPLVVAVSVMPIVALGPVLYGLFGGMFNTARVLVAAIAVAVPVYVNTLRGLQQVLPVHRDLMAAYDASGWQRARAVTLPTGLPHLFTGLRIGSSLAVISALITEYFGGPGDGLGLAIRNSASSGRIALAWAYVVGSIVLGLVFYLATYAAERWFGRHQMSRQR
ncbi:MAG: ABC transporter permease subunit [Nocardioides sp.]|nr:ABC transporter permease subunit [Nocardioides sp.]